MDENIPNLMIHITEDNQERMNSHIMNLRKKKAEKYRRAQRLGTENNWKRYGTRREDLQEAIDEAKVQYTNQMEMQIKPSNQR